ncbi:MAG TPA: hypothetical protein VG076_03795 [Acidimicrobiales bacterium]|jgi:hypothetical protein|nr:hypothetical protein [Acidimicrobiales bacterium]
MRTLRRIGLLGLAGVVIAAFAAPVAHADTPEAFTATGTARALHISVLGQDATFGVTDGTVGAPLTAVANAAGQLLQPATLSKVSLSSDNSTAADPTNGQQRCALPTLPAPLGSLLDLSVACSLAKADITKGLPNALSTAGVANVNVNAQSLLNGVLGNTPLGTLQLGNTVNQVTSALQPVLNAISSATSQTPVQLDPSTTITDLLNSLTTQQTLALSLGNSTSTLGTVASNLTSTATALGGEIKVLPIAALNNTPLADIKVGSSKTSAVYDRAKGAGTASFDPALVTVDLAPVLGLPSTLTHLSVAPGQTITILQGTPLESTITVADGHTTTDGKSASAVADGVSVQLFKGLTALLPTSGTSNLSTAAAAPAAAVVVELAHSESAVTGNPATVSQTPANPAPAAPAEVKALAFTGTSPWLPVGGIILLGGFWGTRRLRRRITA